jgi:MFS family permease
LNERHPLTDRESVAKPVTSSRLQETFAAMKHYNYRLWFSGQVVSLVGTWMQSTAQGYLIYQLTGSPAYLGLVGFMGGLPAWLFTLFGGVIADRISRRNLMVTTQSVMLVLAFILAALTFTKAVQPWHIIVLAFLLGVANAFDAPARIAFVTELVSREDMTNAIALNSTMFNIATVVGPSVAGLTYAAFGPAWCFTLNGISFIAVIVALLFMRIKPIIQPPQRATVMADLREGLRYVFSHSLILSLIGSIGLVSIFGIGMLTLLPAWATDILHGDVTTNGWLVSARGFGSLVSALMLAYLGSRKNRGKLWTLGAFIMPVMLFIFAWIRWLPLALVALLGGWMEFHDDHE